MSKKLLSIKVLSLIFAVLLMQVGFVRPVVAGTNAEKEAKFAEKVKDGIAKLGTGTEAQVKIKLKDKTKLKGYISEAGADSFTVIDADTGVTTSVDYSQVKQAKGNNLSKNVILVITLAAIFAVLIAVIAAGD